MVAFNEAFVHNFAVNLCLRLKWHVASTFVDTSDLGPMLNFAMI